ncbi:alpha/beta fold hydrolase [Primorskyibacter aestuariivivens]|uniref:alpha/beta fold hydrolase n=1 Tax=Primorskyibacter aestuariivivens TaxID=1888912 RepID=UPI002301664C|nr:alpha/beta fold hydrolase [Primorskyibacter aestuariivivens]MDA7428803.1 alpha/beta fold hydrolase [Primorskyibacter aestuariivivens]
MTVEIDRELEAACAKMRPHAARLVEVLRGAGGELVPKNDILSAVWGDIHVSEDSLFQAVHGARRALEACQGYRIETVHGRGYRWHSQEKAGPSPLEQAPVRFATSRDGLRIAWTESGAGIPILKCPNWISHIGMERDSSLHSPFLRGLSRIGRLVRFDQRGNGLSDWDISRFSDEDAVADMEAVVEAAELDRFFLYGASQGVSASFAYAARHPEQVLGIIGRGGYVVGAQVGGDPVRQKNYEARCAVVRAGWDSDNAATRAYLSNLIIANAPDSVRASFDALQRASIAPERIMIFMDYFGRVDVREQAAACSVPVLLLHAEDDPMVPVAAGRQIASMVPRATLVTLPGASHLPVPGTEDFERTLECIESFVSAHGMAQGASQQRA